MLIDDCIHNVAREMSRHKIKRIADWPEEIRKVKPEAQEKINAMTNLELLDLIGSVLDGR